MAMIFRCDRCKRYEDKMLPNSGYRGKITVRCVSMLGVEDALAGSEKEVCGECYNNYTWWLGDDTFEPRSVPIGAKPEAPPTYEAPPEVIPGVRAIAFKFDIRVRLLNDTLESESFSDYAQYDPKMMASLEAATIMVLREYKLIP